jgi:precorrin-6A/cobalt-precorrin-6A reductase
MIFVLAGTKDGREIAAEIASLGYPVVVSVVSDYGRNLVQEDTLTVSAGPLDAAGLSDLIRQRRIRVVIDASHPYAAGVSRNALTACQACGINYLRYERPAVPLPSYDRLHVVADTAAAAKVAASLGKVLFLTTGSRMLKVFKNEPLLSNHRLIARVLPEPGVLAECLALGFTPRDIVALQGPFSHELNMALFKEYGSEVVVTKNSGKVGGSDSKFSAALALGLELVVIDRPAVDYENIVHTNDDIIKFVKEFFT